MKKHLPQHFQQYNEMTSFRKKSEKTVKRPKKMGVFGFDKENRHNGPLEVNNRDHRIHTIMIKPLKEKTHGEVFQTDRVALIKDHAELWANVKNEETVYRCPSKIHSEARQLKQKQNVSRIQIQIELFGGYQDKLRNLQVQVAAKAKNEQDKCREYYGLLMEQLRRAEIQTCIYITDMYNSSQETLFRKMQEIEREKQHLQKIMLEGRKYCCSTSPITVAIEQEAQHLERCGKVQTAFSLQTVEIHYDDSFRFKSLTQVRNLSLLNLLKPDGVSQLPSIIKVEEAENDLYCDEQCFMSENRRNQIPHLAIFEKCFTENYSNEAIPELQEEYLSSSSSSAFLRRQ